MLEEKLVSIVMPVYNSKDYIQESILSIINQTYKNWELIIVNEFGSDEYCTMLVSRFVILDDRIRLLQNEEKLGISESLNIGLRNARGEYIARMDADDIALPNRLKEQVEFLEKNQDILLCGTRVEVFGSESWNWEVETDKNKIAANILFYSPCVHPTIMFRKRLITENGVYYNKAYKASEDYDFFSKVLKFGKISNVNKVLFRYRLYGSNATYINNNIGYIIYNEVMNRQFKELGLNFTKSELENLSVHYSMKGLIGQKAIIRLIELDLLLKKILLANEKKKIYDKEFLFVTLHRRFKEAFDSMSWQCSSYNTEKAREIYEKSIFKNEFFYKQISVSKKNPEVTVLMPTYNSENYIAESIWSILNQSFSDFELLIINEATTKDNTLEMIKLFDDNRIIVEQNKTRLGLAESLNKGIKMAKGKFIARIDADDISHIDRLKIQYKFFKENPEYSFCGTWQRHFGIDTDFVHEAAVEHDEIKARLIYDCDICHSTIMFKKQAFIDNNLFYDKSKQAEDYELWTRAIHKIKFYNIPMVLGEYRVGNDNITKAKLQALSKESGEIAYKNITEYLKVNIPKDHIKYLSGWINEFNNIDNDELYKKHIDIEKNIIIQMYNNNLNLKEYNNKDLLITINKRWSQVINKKPISVDFNTVTSVEDLISLYQKKDNENLEIIESNTKKDSFKQFIKKILKFLYKPFKHGMLYRIRRQLWDLDGHLKESSENIKNTIWDSEGHIKDYCRDKIKELELSISSDIDNRFLLLSNKLDGISEVLNRAQEYEELKLNYILKYINSNSIEIEKILSQKFDTRIWKAEENLSQQLDARVWKAEENLSQQLDARVWKAEEKLGQQLDTRVWKAEENLVQQLDARVWKAEENLSQKLDARVWKAEENLSQKLDARVWKAEENLSQKLDARVWKAEENLGQQLDTRVWKAEENLGQQIDTRVWKAEIYLKKEILKRVWNIERKLSKIYSLNNSKDNNVSNDIYGDIFYEDNQYSSFVSGLNVLKKLLPELLPKSIVDFGCGTGTWLAAAKAINRNIEVVGVDGDYVNRDMLMIDESSFIPFDLTGAIDLGRKFDLAISLEVAEHIDKEYADRFIDNICRHSDTILFSAAHVGQGGDGHVNEQPIEYWIDKFSNRGYKLTDIREQFKNNPDIDWWYKDNMVLFIK